MKNKKDDKLCGFAIKRSKISLCIKYGICTVPPTGNSQLIKQRNNKVNYRKTSNLAPPCLSFRSRRKRFLFAVKLTRNPSFSVSISME